MTFSRCSTHDIFIDQRQGPKERFMLAPEANSHGRFQRCGAIS